MEIVPPKEIPFREKKKMSRQGPYHKKMTKQLSHLETMYGIYASNKETTNLDTWERKSCQDMGGKYHGGATDDYKERFNLT